MRAQLKLILSVNLHNRCTRMRKRNPLVLNGKAARSGELAEGVLLFGGEGKLGRAVARIGSDLAAIDDNPVEKLWAWWKTLRLGRRR